MTLLDSVDTLKILGLEKEFEEATRWIQTNATFDLKIQAPVFEFNIRIVGGLLAAYDLSKNPLFLEKARDMADRLLPAFSTPSGYPTVAILLADSLDVCESENGSCVISVVDTEQRHSGGTGNDVSRIPVLLLRARDSLGISATTQRIPSTRMSSIQSTRLSRASPRKTVFCQPSWIRQRAKEHRATSAWEPWRIVTTNICSRCGFSRGRRTKWERVIRIMRSRCVGCTTKPSRE